MKRLGYLTVIGLVVLAAIIAVRIAILSGAIAAEPEAEPVNEDRAALIAGRLGEAIRIKTISTGDIRSYDSGAFEEFHAFLAEAYPAAHAAMEREVVGGKSLLFRWPGSGEAAPIILLAHMDVVPVQPGTEEIWEQEPFSGAVVEGAVWGRGALDDKASLIALMEAFEALAAEGLRPRRDIYLAFGHDEEIGGKKGAGAIAALLAERGLRFAWCLDEGSAMVPGLLADPERPAAIISVAEKGYVSLQLTATGASGHSSAPSGELAVFRLARALKALEDNPYPMELKGPAADLLKALAPEMTGAKRFAINNLWLTGALVASSLSSEPAFDAMTRTTIAPTMLRAGLKDNVLPQSATAVVNFRIHPRDSVESVIERTQEIVGEDIGISIWLDEATDPSPVSSTDTDGYRALVAAVQDVYGDDILAAPGLTIGGTDAKHYVPLADAAYRFLPITFRGEDTKRLHGNNERVMIDDLYRMVRVYEELIRAEAG